MCLSHSIAFRLQQRTPSGAAAHTAFATFTAIATKFGAAKHTRPNPDANTHAYTYAYAQRSLRQS